MTFFTSLGIVFSASCKGVDMVVDVCLTTRINL